MEVLNDITKVFSKDTIIPYFADIKIVAQQNCIVLSRVDYDTYIERNVPLTINQERLLEVKKVGSVIISYMYLSKILKESSNEVQMKANGQGLIIIKSNNFVTQINESNRDEYPIPPKTDDAKSFNIDSKELLDLIEQTTFAISKSETRPVLQGVYILFKENHLTCIATDSHRLVIKEFEIKSSVSDSIIVPGTSLNKIIPLIKKQTDVIQVFVLNNYIVFKASNLSLYIRLLDGKYPDVYKLLPNDFKSIITLNTTQLLQGFKRMCLFGNNRFTKVDIEITLDTKIRLSYDSPEIGTVDTINIKEIHGDDDLKISINSHYIIDALSQIKEEYVKISFARLLNTVVIEPMDDSSYLQLVLALKS